MAEDGKADAYYMGYIKWGAKNNILVGIGGGKTGNLFDPQGPAIRAEVSSVLHRFMELTIFSLIHPDDFRI